MPVPAVVEPAHAVGRPGNDMRYAGYHLLLASRAPVGLGRVGAGDPADEPVAVTVGLAAFDPTDGSPHIKLGSLVASAVGSGHRPIIAGGISERVWSLLPAASLGCRNELGVGVSVLDAVAVPDWLTTNSTSWCFWRIWIWLVVDSGGAWPPEPPLSV